MDYFKPDQAITADGKHRVLAFIVPASLSEYEIERRLNESGMYYGALKSFGEPLDNGKAQWTVLVEPRFGGVTPAYLANELGASALLVMQKPVAWPVEQYLDLQEITQHPTLTELFKPGESVYPDNVWRAALAHYERQPMSVAQIVSVLRGAGFDVATESDLGLIQNTHDVFLYIRTTGQTPRIEELQRRLGADMFSVNKHTSTADVDFAVQWSRGVNALENQVKDVGKALLSSTKGTGELAENLLNFTEVVSKAAVPVLAGLLGWWVYNRFKEAKAD